MSLRSIFESIWNYDFSHWFVYFAIAFGVLFNFVIILRLAIVEAYEADQIKTIKQLNVNFINKKK